MSTTMKHQLNDFYTSVIKWTLVIGLLGIMLLGWPVCSKASTYDNNDYYNNAYPYSTNNQIDVGAYQTAQTQQRTQSMLDNQYAITSNNLRRY